MLILSKYQALVNEHIAVQEKLARRFAPEAKGANEFRHSLHQSNVERFKELAAALEEADKQLAAAPVVSAPSANPPVLTLSLNEIADLPEELRGELSESAIPDKLEMAILGVLEDRGGIASLDQILVGIYRKTAEITKRTTLTSRLYRMTSKNSVHTVPNKKGVYSLRKLSAEEAARLFGEDAPEGQQLPLNDD